MWITRFVGPPRGHDNQLVDNSPCGPSPRLDVGLLLAADLRLGVGRLRGRLAGDSADPLGALHV